MLNHAINAKLNGHGVAIKRSQPVKPGVQFMAGPNYKAYLDHMKKFPKQSVDGLADIKREEVAEAPKHQKHIAKAMEYGKKDENIKWFNGKIMSLLKVRTGQKESNPTASEAARQDLVDMRDALNEVLKANGYSDKGQKLDQSA